MNPLTDLPEVITEELALQADRSGAWCIAPYYRGGEGDVLFLRPTTPDGETDSTRPWYRCTWSGGYRYTRLAVRS